jgi:hypothetical protein
MIVPPGIPCGKFGKMIIKGAAPAAPPPFSVGAAAAI